MSLILSCRCAPFASLPCADRVINLFMKLLGAREASKPSELPKCHFMQTNFYTKLAEGRSGYCYKDVRRWTKKVRSNFHPGRLTQCPLHMHPPPTHCASACTLLIVA